MNLQVKICGITSLEDALQAAQSGADALGFMFFPGSSRFITPAAAAQITRQLPAHIAKVGVFVNAQADAIRHCIDECRLDTLQFHGEETPEFCHQFLPLTLYRAFRIKDAQSLEALPAFTQTFWLLDSYVAGQLGGTGARFNWNLAVEAQRHGRPILLAGGLTPENVAEAVRAVKPYGVDVSSGVESAPGRKDPAKVRAFIAAAKGALR